MMCTQMQCQVSFSDGFDGLTQNEAAIFIVSRTSLMMSDSFCQCLANIRLAVQNKEALIFTFVRSYTRFVNQEPVVQRSLLTHFF